LASHPSRRVATPDPLLCDLAAEVAEVAGSLEHKRRRQRWAALHHLEPGVTLINAAIYPRVWEREIGVPGGFAHEHALAHSLESQLRLKLWKATEIPDDGPVLPWVTLWVPRPENRRPLWGLEPASHLPDAHGGAYKPIPLILEDEDLERLSWPRCEVDEPARIALEEQAAALLGGRLQVKFAGDELGCGPFEWAVRFCSMNQLLYDVYDRPAFVHRLMEFFTEGTLRYQQSREKAGLVDATQFDWHAVYDEVPADLSPTSLAATWAYVHAQSAASFSPEMYAEFIQPYNARVASLYWRVYYHGCEDLSRKASVIRDLPHLALFHISPWTPPAPVVETLGTNVAYEVHSHPTRVLFDDTETEMVRDLQEREAVMRGLPHSLTLCDVETFNGRLDRLVRWAERAREEADRAGGS
jgi:hypothetical protein